MDLAYLDFELVVHPGQGREFAVAVVKSPSGEAEAIMTFPYDELALESRLKSLEIALLRSGGQRRKALTDEEQAVQEFGSKLFDALFTGEVRSRFDVAQEKAAQQGMGLRVKLRIQSPELAALPWEYLFDKRQGKYIALSHDTPLVRYLELPTSIKPLEVEPPLRVLAMIASPTDLPALDTEREKLRVQAAIDSLPQGAVQLTWLPGATWHDLQRAMRRGPWHIFYFIGHGGFDRLADEGLLALENDQHKAHLLKATQLASLIADHKSLRLAVLNSCEGARASDLDVFSSTAAILVRHGIPAVLAMQYEITDHAAIEFSHSFFEALADGLPVDAAVTEARKSIHVGINNTFEWGTPVLYMRAADGVLFRVPKERIVEERRAPPQVAEPVPVPAQEERAPAVFAGGETPSSGLELCKDCGARIKSTDWTCPHCGYTQWGPICAAMLFSIGCFVGAIYGYLHIEHVTWRNVIGWAGSAIGLLMLVIAIVEIATALKARKRYKEVPKIAMAIFGIVFFGALSVLAFYGVIYFERQNTFGSGTVLSVITLLLGLFCAYGGIFWFFVGICGPVVTGQSSTLEVDKAKIRGSVDEALRELKQSLGLFSICFVVAMLSFGAAKYFELVHVLGPGNAASATCLVVAWLLIVGVTGGVIAILKWWIIYKWRKALARKRQ